MRHGWDFAGRSTAALHLTVWIVVLGAGCKVYKDQLLEGSSTMAGASAPAAGAGAGATSASASDAGPSTDSGPSDDGQDPCANGECWWSKNRGEDCRTASMPVPGDRPMDEEDAPAVDDIYLGFSQIRLGDGSENQTENAWEGVGFDLDGLCTNSASCDGAQQTGCRSPGPAMPYDGELCRDNTFGRLQPVLAKVPGLGDTFGLTESVLNCQLWRGGFNMVVRVSGYNGRPNDPRVRVDYYLSSGLEEATTWKCPTDNFRLYPRWRALRTWAIDDRALTGPIVTPGTLPDSKSADPDAYVKNGYLVARVPDGTEQGFIGDGDPHRGFVFKSRRGVFVGRLLRVQDGTWDIEDGLLGGRIRKDDLERAFRESGFCERADLNTFYQSMLEFLDETADVLASGDIDEKADCDAISYGIGFEASQLVPGRAVKVPPRLECCAPGQSIEECMASCGDGKVNRDEKCDTAIPAGEPGACPASCEVTDACVPQMRVGSECATECKPVPITMIGAKDDCCPAGATVMTDLDCKSTCGNGVIEAGETCDPPSECGCAESQCFTVRASGSAESCNLRCEYLPVETCSGDDGCCPANCTPNADADCSNRCGDDTVDEGETCELRGMSACPVDCSDNDPCTVDRASGSANNCSLRCVHTAIREAVNGDQCCPPGASANSDNDCTPECGNGAIEPGEECDDGNARAGDGCVECRAENSLEVCLMQRGANDACAQCACRNCATQVEACYVTEDSNDKACQNLVNCSARVGCGNPNCYCGQASLFACFAGAGSGLCRREVERAAGSENVFDINARNTDLNYPLGRANALFTCMERFCPQECERR